MRGLIQGVHLIERRIRERPRPLLFDRIEKPASEILYGLGHRAGCEEEEQTGEDLRAHPLMVHMS